jgi:hypothetical protein
MHGPVPRPGPRRARPSADPTLKSYETIVAAGSHAPPLAGPARRSPRSPRPSRPAYRPHGSQWKCRGSATLDSPGNDPAREIRDGRSPPSPRPTSPTTTPAPVSPYGGASSPCDQQVGPQPVVEGRGRRRHLGEPAHFVQRRQRRERRQAPPAPPVRPVTVRRNPVSRSGHADPRQRTAVATAPARDVLERRATAAATRPSGSTRPAAGRAGRQGRRQLVLRHTLAPEPPQARVPQRRPGRRPGAPWRTTPRRARSPVRTEAGLSPGVRARLAPGHARAVGPARGPPVLGVGMRARSAVARFAASPPAPANAPDCKPDRPEPSPPTRAAPRARDPPTAIRSGRAGTASAWPPRNTVPANATAWPQPRRRDIPGRREDSDGDAGRPGLEVGPVFELACIRGLLTVRFRKESTS